MLDYGSFGGLWLVAIAYLLGQSAKGALVQTALTERIEGSASPTSWTRQPVAIPCDDGRRPSARRVLHALRLVWFPVIDDDGRFIGIARRSGCRPSADRGEGWLTVGAVLESGGAEPGASSEDRPITELLSSEPLGRLGALMAVDGEGVLRGVVTVEQVRRALQSALGSPAA